MTISFEPSVGGNYQTLVERLLALDREDKPRIELGEVLPHFIQIQSLVRSCVEYCDVAFRESNLGHVFPARALLRSAFDHVILASYLFKHPYGPETTQLILDKNNRELANKATAAGAIESGAKLLEVIKTPTSENEKISTRTNNLIENFKEKNVLHDFYFLLGQAVHPKAAFSQYLDLDEVSGERRIRRTSLDRDASSVHPFTFQILSIALLLDADSRNNESLRVRIIELSKYLAFGPELSV